MIDVIVTGSRSLLDKKIVWDKLYEVEKEFGGIRTLVEGGCEYWDKDRGLWLGADRWARLWPGKPQARRTVDAQWFKFGKAAGPIRNGVMLAEFPQALVLAFPKGESKGTRDCIKQAEKLAMTVRIFECT